MKQASSSRRSRIRLFDGGFVPLAKRRNPQPSLKYADKLDQLAAEVRGYVDTLEQSRTFSPISRAASASGAGRTYCPV